MIIEEGPRGSTKEKAKGPTAYSTATGAKKAWNAGLVSTPCMKVLRKFSRADQTIDDGTAPP